MSLKLSPKKPAHRQSFGTNLDVHFKVSFSADAHFIRFLESPTIFLQMGETAVDDGTGGDAHGARRG